MKKLLLILFAAATLSAQPVITSVTPSTGPIEGGTQVTIKGTGFHNCLFCNPPVPLPVYFGGTYAAGSAINPTTIIADVPPHFAGTVDITVVQEDGTATRPNAFTYTGVFEDKFERILLPLFTEPVTGAFGSRFITQLRVANGPVKEAYIFGLTASPSADPFENPIMVHVNAVIDPTTLQYTGTPGKFVYVPVTSATPEFNLRVFDESRSAFNFGTELPVVFERRFSTAPFKLLGVPLDPRFRKTLRLYATGETTAAVRIGDVVHNVHIAAGRNLFDPAYAQFIEFPVGEGTVDITVAPSTITVPFPGASAPLVWGFISVTNNDTQLITTITP
jgi:IPT/TIG domain